MDSDNLIGSVKLELKLSSHAPVKESDERLDALTDESVVPVLKRLADEYSKYGIDMESIEVDLGRITQEDFSFTLERELRAKLDQMVRSLPIPVELLADDSGLFSISIDVSPDTPTGDGQVLDQSLSDEVHGDVMALVRYLENSEFKWTEHPSDFDPIRMLERIFSDAVTSERFISGLSERGLVGVVWILDAIVSEPELVQEMSAGQDGESLARSVLEQVLSRLSEVSPKQMETLEIRRKQWRSQGYSSEVYGNVPRRDQNKGHDGMLVAALNGNSQTPESSVHRMTEIDDALQDSGPLLSDRDTALQQPTKDGEGKSYAPDTMGNYESNKRERIDSVPYGSEDLEAEMKNASLDTADDESCSTISADGRVMAGKREWHDDGDSWADELLGESDDALDGLPYAFERRLFISDAGLVLVHPFMKHLFRNLGMLDERNGFISSKARIRAVHLLKQVTGIEGPHYDHCVVLEKIMCGIAPQVQLPVEWKPTDEETEEVNNMLEAVKSYWAPLTRSSVDALRSAFIQREGCIEKTEDSYLVRVEGSAMDILLDDLPWETSLIMLPWLENPIIVEWQK